ncbi:MAG: hypothetical protein GY862_17630 [Gammaproteobacteria bacterium]|nr:hypothetical protein [Gammaproteobacteria bacterium]
MIIWRCTDPDSAAWESQLLHTFPEVVWHVSWSVCGSILAVSGGDNKVAAAEA